jgi:hypothetical protein
MKPMGRLLVGLRLLRGQSIGRIAFRKVVQFRYTFDLDYMQGFSLTIARQYFEDFIPLGADQCSWTEAGTMDKQRRPSFAERPL